VGYGLSSGPAQDTEEQEIEAVRCGM